MKVLLYSAEQYAAETRFQNVTKAVHVQAAIGIDDPVAETSWLQEQADRVGFPHAIVGHCDLASADAERTLERHLEYANFRGIRDFGAGEHLADPTWRRGYALLAERNLVFGLDTTWEQMADVRALADEYQGVVLAVDHAGFPRARDAEYFENWRTGMTTLAGVVLCSRR